MTRLPQLQDILSQRKDFTVCFDQHRSAHIGHIVHSLIYKYTDKVCIRGAKVIIYKVNIKN